MLAGHFTGTFKNLSSTCYLSGRKKKRSKLRRPDMLRQLYTSCTKRNIEAYWTWYSIFSEKNAQDKYNIFATANADANADGDAEVPMPRFPNGLSLPKSTKWYCQH